MDCTAAIDAGPPDRVGRPFHGACCNWAGNSLKLLNFPVDDEYSPLCDVKQTDSVLQPNLSMRRIFGAPTESRMMNQEHRMGINKDQVEGRLDQAQGKIKEVVGNAVGNKTLEVKGNIQKNVGAVQASIGDARHDIEKAVNKP